jgi:hypothetical protein
LREPLLGQSFDHSTGSISLWLKDWVLGSVEALEDLFFPR